MWFSSSTYVKLHVLSVIWGNIIIEPLFIRLWKWDESFVLRTHGIDPKVGRNFRLFVFKTFVHFCSLSNDSLGSLGPLYQSDTGKLRQSGTHSKRYHHYCTYVLQYDGHHKSRTKLSSFRSQDLCSFCLLWNDSLGSLGPLYQSDTGKPLHYVKVEPIRRGTIIIALMCCNMMAPSLLHLCVANNDGCAEGTLYFTPVIVYISSGSLDWTSWYELKQWPAQRATAHCLHCHLVSFLNFHSE